MVKKNEVLNWCFEIISEHAPSVSGLGLMNGKTGIALALYKAQFLNQSKNIITIGEDLVEDVCENIKNNLSLNFSNGLGGIGWGFEYGFQQDFFEGDSDEFLIDIDRKHILSLVYKKPNSLCLHEGILGYCFYFLNRLQGTNSHEESFSTITNMHCLKLSLEELKLILIELDYGIDEPESFSILSDLPLIFILLGECIEKKYFVDQAIEIAENLIKKTQEKLPRKASFKLILSLVLEYYQLKSKTILKINNLSVVNFKELKEDLKGKYGLNGYSGIALLSYKIFKMNNNEKFKNDAFEYIQLAEDIITKIKDKAKKNPEQIINLGLNNGLSGFIFSHAIINKNE
ncbi:hypothetical protein Q4Q35_08270 [Flavivirga aquimarina]|uniref:Lantibiotic biosynthesis protein n=1 Tax=Flavivirga aquimarina TaxID=2027862 RepID=A0ABT8W9I8_9FLAO|nr:hypothetical protein [Flavivirga aquimarina]MDO5969800.1 hypothetical protein [Flavivirga aquimarina]